LEWNVDGRDRSSSFKLGDGDTYVEQEFRVGIDGLFYDEPRRFKLSISESDPDALAIVKLFTDLLHESAGAPGGLFSDVLEFGTHIVPYSITSDLADCSVRLDFATTFAISERGGN
jgi:hypothetical protein